MHPLAGVGIFLIVMFFTAFSRFAPAPITLITEPLVAAVASSTPIAPVPPPPAHREPWHRVVRVVDGDTVVVDIGGTSTKLRLIGLDTPEVVDPRKPVQCFGKEASTKAKELLEGARVRIEMDTSQGTVDKYGRTLAYVYMEDGTLFNKKMISDGYGHEYTYRLPYRYQTDFKAAEKTAREEKRGLWADNACAPAQ
jgi:micrococcal nuclease